jgi:MoxR-like ATPase
LLRKESETRRTFIAAWLAVLAVKCMLAVHLPLFVDEAFYWQEGMHRAWAYSDLPGLTAWLARIGVAVFGRETFGLRIPFLLLADEINRAPPRTQSALLEAMAEEQVSIDGTTHVLPRPFFVIATQNPADLAGTYPLPDSQLDRFLLRLSLGYPGEAAERELLTGADRRDLIANATPQLGPESVLELREAVNRIHASDALLDYVQALLRRSRHHPGVRTGLSPRAGIAMLRAARAHALLLGRAHVVPEDVQALFIHIAAHRLAVDVDGGDGRALAKAILHAVPVD